MKKLILALAPLILGASLAAAHPAIFCRDCPFPSRVADGKWVMPNGLIQIDIDEQVLDGKMSHINVTLTDPRTGALIASGEVLQSRYKKTLVVDMTDRDGHPIKGYVRYTDASKENIQAKFTCELCRAHDWFD